MNLISFSTEVLPRLESIFLPYLEKIPSLPLKNAMHNALQNKGKCIRPLLVYATGYLFNAPLATLDVAAAAIEIIHTYSLIHDDLPCMDNADLRRHQPTCHKVFGDAIATLAGDALQTLALEILAAHPAPMGMSQRLQMIQALTRAAGAEGMAAGQALDLSEMDHTLTAAKLEQIHRLKTGALLACAIDLGQIAANHTSPALKELGQLIGLAFQIQDDLLDVSQHPELGKTQHLDRSNHKLTYVYFHGIEKSCEKAQSLYEAALSRLPLDNRAALLRELITSLIRREK